jgi:hypothetical protein
MDAPSCELAAIWASSFEPGHLIALVLMSQVVTSAATFPESALFDLSATQHLAVAAVVVMQFCGTSWGSAAVAGFSLSLKMLLHELAFEEVLLQYTVAACCLDLHGCLWGSQLVVCVQYGRRPHQRQRLQKAGGVPRTAWHGHNSAAHECGEKCCFNLSDCVGKPRHTA